MARRSTSTASSSEAKLREEVKSLRSTVKNLQATLTSAKATAVESPMEVDASEGDAEVKADPKGLRDRLKFLKSVDANERTIFDG